MRDEYEYQLARFIDKHSGISDGPKVTKTALKEIWKEAWENNSRLGTIASAAESLLKFYKKGLEKSKQQKKIKGS